MNFLQAVDIASCFAQRLRRAGLAWEMLGPDAAESVLLELRQHGADQNVWLDPSMVQLSVDNYFLIVLRSEGVPVAKMGARIDTVTEGFSNFAERMLRTIYRDQNGRPSFQRFSPELEGLNGRIAYIGDLAVTKDAPRVVRSPLSPVVMSLLFLTIDQVWGAPDHTICWTRPSQRVAKALGPAWRWVEGTGSFSQPASSEFRNYNLGILDGDRYSQQLQAAANLAAQLAQETSVQQTDVEANAPTDSHALAHN